MRPYEAMVVLRPGMEEAAQEAILNRLTSVISDQGGQITHVDQWGKRRLAYAIDDHIEGFYVVIKFQGNPGITTELERIMRISDPVMRFLVVRDETPAVPAAATGKDARGMADEEADADGAQEAVEAEEAHDPSSDGAPEESPAAEGETRGAGDAGQAAIAEATADAPGPDAE